MQYITNVVWIMQNNNINKDPNILFYGFDNRVIIIYNTNLYLLNNSHPRQMN